MTVEVRARWYAADGSLVAEEDRLTAASCELEEVETETGYVLGRTYASLSPLAPDFDNSAAFAVENSDFPKGGTWDLFVPDPEDEDGPLVLVDSLARYEALFGRSTKAGLCALAELPAFDVAPERLRTEVLEFLRAGQAGVGGPQVKAAGLAPPSDAARDAERERWASFIERWERRVSDVLERFYERQEAVVLARLRGVKARRGTRHWDPRPPQTEVKAIDVQAVLPPGKFMAEVQADISQTVLLLFQATAAQVGEGEAPALLLDAPEVQDAVRARIARLMSGTEERAEQVRRVLVDADASDADLEEIVNLVRGEYTQRQIWASGAARNEVTPAVNVAALLEAARTGLTTKTWLSSRDDRVRFTHTANGGGDGQDKALFTPYVIGGFPLMYPGDPTGPPQETYGCRCVSLFRKDEDAPEPPAHPYWSWLAEALETLLGWLGVDEMPDGWGPEALEGRGDRAELLAELIQVHRAQAANNSPKAPTTRALAAEVARDVLPEGTISALEAAMHALEVSV